MWGILFIGARLERHLDAVGVWIERVESNWVGARIEVLGGATGSNC